MAENGKTLVVWWENLKKIRLIGRHRHRWKRNIKMYIKEMGLYYIKPG